MSAPTVTVKVFVRHGGDCTNKDPYYRRCKCKKHLYVYANGKVSYKSTGTRAWAAAEDAAQKERDRHDPRKMQPVETTRKTFAAALEQWIAGMKSQRESSLSEYRATTRKILRWTERIGLVYVDEATPASLDMWRSGWGPDAAVEEDRMSQHTQANTLWRLKSFFRWALAMEFCPRNPSLALKGVIVGDSETQPLDPAQFEALLLAVSGDDLRERQLHAIFQLQRWTGLRIGDAAWAHRDNLAGNRFTAVIRKERSRAAMEFMLPDHVVKELNALPVEGDLFFPTVAQDDRLHAQLWSKRVGELGLVFSREDGEHMTFHSHMLRDTFAVEMLLADVPLEHVSRLLGHKDVRTTQRYYAKWTKRRKQKLEDAAVSAMRRMGVTFGGD
jgi:integrase/recombinase XerD